MTRGIRTLCAALAVAAGVLSAPAAAEGDFVIAGSTSGWVDVELPDRQTYDITWAVVETKGRFGGFVAEQLTSTYDQSTVGNVSGYVALRALTTDGSLSEPEPVGITRLTSGVVRFYLVADGPTTVRIPWSFRLPARTVRPRHPTAASLQVVPLRGTGDAWGAEAPFAAPAKATTMVGLVATGQRVEYSQARFCVAARGTGCPTSPWSTLFTAIGSRTATPSDEYGRARYWVAAYQAVPPNPAARYSIAATESVSVVSGAYGVRFSLTRV